VLVQIGLLNAKDLPVAGAETARKVLDASLPSNALLGDVWQSSEGRPI
jgi:carboxymethylenebutenolidase